MQFDRWVRESPRFRVFAETYRDKIRKKVRGILEPEGYRDLQAELATAFFLVGEKRFVVEYEKYGTGKQRGPDFSVTYKTHVRFDVEVTRIRSGHDSLLPDPGRLAYAICAKVQQLPPSIMNLLVLETGDVTFTAGDLDTAIVLLQERLAQRDDEFFTRRGFAGARDFIRHYGRLSAVRLVSGGAPAVLRLQPEARHPLPPELANILRR